MSDPYGWIARSMAGVRRAGWYRSVQAVEGGCGPVVRVAGREVVNLASNDYLGLASDPQVVGRAIAVIEKYGTGATGSRLLSGHRQLHRDLEGAIARLKNTEDALVFSSGYLANIGTIPALVTQRDVIFADAYNHSSLKSGAKLSGATVVTYPHSDVQVLADELRDKRAQYRRCLILTDGVFGMDGDVCALPEILDLAEQYEAMVMIDEAHSAGVLGRTGAGSAEFFGCEDGSLLQMGTLSKAFASLGGYVAGCADVIDYLRNRAAGWIYTTGLSPGDTAAALAAIERLRAEPKRVEWVQGNRQYLRSHLQQAIDELNLTGKGFKCLPSDSAIVCVQVPDTETVVRLGKEMRSRGIFVSAVRPPTVPVSRLRMSVMATHDRSHLDQCINAFKSCVQSIPDLK